jgi:hypothetical protein
MDNEIISPATFEPGNNWTFRAGFVLSYTPNVQLDDPIIIVATDPPDPVRLQFESSVSEIASVDTFTLLEPATGAIVMLSKTSCRLAGTGVAIKLTKIVININFFIIISFFSRKIVLAQTNVFDCLGSSSHRRTD